METRFHRNVRPRARNGYHYFANAWNLEVAERYQRYVEGEDDNVILIRRKSFMQLQKHYDNLQQKKRLAMLSDSQRDQELRNQMRIEMRETRQEVPDLPQIQNAAPIQYPTNTNGTVPFGMPMALNPTMLQGAILQAPTLHVNTLKGRPFVINPPTVTASVLTGFRKLTWCITCGFRKNQHIIKEESFGTKCKRSYCAKCGWLKTHHQNHSMGPFCNQNPRHDSPHLLWYNNNQNKQTANEQESRQVGII